VMGVRIPQKLQQVLSMDIPLAVRTTHLAASTLEMPEIDPAGDGLGTADTEQLCDALSRQQQLCPGAQPISLASQVDAVDCGPHPLGDLGILHATLQVAGQLEQPLCRPELLRHYATAPFRRSRMSLIRALRC